MYLGFGKIRKLGENGTILSPLSYLIRYTLIELARQMFVKADEAVVESTTDLQNIKDSLDALEFLMNLANISVINVVEIVLE